MQLVCIRTCKVFRQSFRQQHAVNLLSLVVLKKIKGKGEKERERKEISEGEGGNEVRQGKKGENFV